MPYRKRKFTRRSSFRRRPRRTSLKVRKQRKRKQAKRRSRAKGAKAGRGLPDFTYVTLKYHEQVEAAGAGNTAQVIFRGNGPYDPYSSGIGGQPFQWDTYANQYYNYKCYGSKIVVRAMAAGVTAGAESTQAFKMLLVPHSSNASITLGSNFDAWVEEMKAKLKYLNLATADISENIMSHSCSTKEMYGLSEAELGGPAFSALVTTVPNNQWYWHVVCAPIDIDVVAHPDIFFDVTIYYKVKFSQRKPLAGLQ